MVLVPHDSVESPATVIELTTEQQHVADRAEDFIRAPRVDRPYFLYEGLAGVGKTAVLSHIARQHPDALLCSFMGKAASNLSRKTGLPSTTIHSAIYSFLGTDRESGQPNFELKVDSGDWSGHVALVDESGTIGAALACDLLATGCRVIACGDPGQLRPVNDTRYFTEPNAMLTQVHRQAWDSAIIRQAHSVRNGRGYRADGPDFRVQRFVEHEDIVAADIVLCWRNATRRDMNRLVRAHKGYTPNCPYQVGEPVMCLRNDHSRGVLNGAVYELLEEHVAGKGYLSLRNERGSEIEVPAWIEDFELAPYVKEGNKSAPAMFAPAYCATVHKGIGSEWNNVILIDEYDRMEEREQFLYCGITRAAKRILIQRNNA